MKKTIMDTPRERTILVGKNRIGLQGLDAALDRLSNQTMTDAEAVDYLFEAVRQRNYIPETAEPLYREALRREYRAGRHPSATAAPTLTIRVLGPDCVSCNRLKTMLFDILDRLNLAADIEETSDMDEIWRHGVTRTPALIVNGRIRSEGLLPTRAQVEEWIREVAC